jgi:Tfp pilus assembly protein PilF
MRYKNLEKAITLDPNLATTYLNLWTWYELQDDLENAKINYKKSYDLDPEGPIGVKAGEKFNEIIK